MKATWLGLALLLPGMAAGQVYKCVDAAGKISYTSGQCSALGLKDVGEVGDRINVSPSYRPPAGYRPAPPPAEPPRQAQQPAAAEEAKPERRCFTTAKGTRCNDKPEDDAPAEAPR
jgi:hypothetical protein